MAKIETNFPASLVIPQLLSLSKLSNTNTYQCKALNGKVEFSFKLTKILTYRIPAHETNFEPDNSFNNKYVKIHLNKNPVLILLRQFNF